MVAKYPLLHSLARATRLSEQQEVLFPQLLEPCPTLPFIITPPCQSSSRCFFCQILGLWVALAGRGGVIAVYLSDSYRTLTGQSLHSYQTVTLPSALQPPPPPPRCCSPSVVATWLHMLALLTYRGFLKHVRKRKRRSRWWRRSRRRCWTPEGGGWPSAAAHGHRHMSTPAVRQEGPPEDVCRGLLVVWQGHRGHQRR